MDKDLSPASDRVLSGRKHWYAMRDLRPWNAKKTAFQEMKELGLTVYTPMRQISKELPNGKKTKELTPVMPTLLFVYEEKERLDRIVRSIRLLQYIYRKGAGQQAVTIVRDSEMDRFIAALECDKHPLFLNPLELTPDRVGKKVIVVGGPLNEYQGFLLKSPGARKQRIILEIKGFFAAAVQVDPKSLRIVS